MKAPVTTPPMLASRGFSLLEVLVALLILAVGLLGVAAMQVRGLKFNHDAQLRTQASVVAMDIMDRMRLNSSGNWANYKNGTGFDTSTTPGTCSATTASTASNDLACWYTLGVSLLPKGSIMLIDDSSTVASGYDITVSWTDRDGATRSLMYTFQPL